MPKQRHTMICSEHVFWGRRRSTPVWEHPLLVHRSDSGQIVPTCSGHSDICALVRGGCPRCCHLIVLTRLDRDHRARDGEADPPHLSCFRCPCHPPAWALLRGIHDPQLAEVASGLDVLHDYLAIARTPAVEEQENIRRTRLRNHEPQHCLQVLLACVCYVEPCTLAFSPECV